MPYLASYAEAMAGSQGSGYLPSFVSVAVITYSDKSSLEEEAFIRIHGSGYSPSLRRGTRDSWAHHTHRQEQRDTCALCSNQGKLLPTLKLGLSQDTPPRSARCRQSSQRRSSQVSPG